MPKRFLTAGKSPIADSVAANHADRYIVTILAMRNVIATNRCLPNSCSMSRRHSMAWKHILEGMAFSLCNMLLCGLDVCYGVSLTNLCVADFPDLGWQLPGG